jgi:hypothetical protein
VNSSPSTRKSHAILRKIYHQTRWICYSTITGGRAGKIYIINPAAIVDGQLPHNQFPRRARRLVRGGEWDREVIAIEDHSVYKSMFDHFVGGMPWDETVHYREALELLEAGKNFRGGQSRDEIESFFADWDLLYRNIEKHGFRSNGDLYREGVIDNPCRRLDEVTVNLSRDGVPLLNDGWHRFCIARILKISPIPVRILARHEAYPRWIPAGQSETGN